MEMRTDDHQTMLQYYIESEKSNYRNSIMKEFTRANMLTLLIWLGLGLYQGIFHLVFWLHLLAVLFSIFLSGLFADWIWFWMFSSNFKKTFSLMAYLSRLPVYLFLTCALAVPVTWFIGLFQIEWFRIVIYCLSFQLIYQFFNQWFFFNRLRKLSLTEL
jgi:hypothetical protein